MTDSTVDGNDVIGAVAGGGSTADPLSELVGDGKKFKTVEDLAKGKLESDNFIAKLQAENNELRTLLKTTEEKVIRAATVEDILKRVEGVSKPTSTPAASGTDGNQPVSLTREDVVNLLAQREQEAKAKANYAMANRTLVEAYGDKAKEVVATKAAELGISPAMLKAMAETSPKAFLTVLGVGSAPSAPSVSRTGSAGRGNVNTAAISNSPPIGEVRNQSFYDKMRKEMGAIKFATNTNLQVQMHKDMERLGDAFFS